MIRNIKKNDKMKRISEKLGGKVKLANSQERGITLVALVITIVILIILATVTINAVFGDNGLIKQAELAKDLSSNSTEAEYEGLNNLFDQFANVISEDSEISVPPTEPDKIADIKPNTEDNIDYFDKTTELKDDSGDSVWVPGGFGITEDSATDADNGVVIQDAKGNEFVWIPVPDYTTMYVEAAGTKLSGESSGVTTTTDVYSKLRVRENDEYYYTPSMPGDAVSYIREPDLVIECDAQEQYYKDILGYDSLKDMADAMIAEYTATYNSIKKYKGFYIGRYELTGSVAEPTVQKGQTVLTADVAPNWYNLKKACSNVVSSEYAQSEMIYGNQYDEVMSWLKATVFKDDTDKVDVDSKSWGNYEDSTGEAATNSGTKQPSGTNEAWKANNIYDLAGNCFEWTQEAYDTGFRVYRGGCYGNTGFDYSASFRYDRDPDNTDSADSSRPALYIK